MLETAAAQRLFMIESIRRVTGKVILNKALHCLTRLKSEIDMIEEKTKVTNSDERRLRREAKALAIVGTIKARSPDISAVITVIPPKPDPTFTFWKQPNDTFPMGSIVYFMYSAGRIKIGYSDGLRGRQKQLTSAGPFPPVVLLIMNGTQETERGLHLDFAHDRLHGEWFALSKQIRSWLMSRLCDIGRASMDRAEAEFRDYCAVFLESYRAPSKRKPRTNCPHGKPVHQSCCPCERERDLKILEQINNGSYTAA